MCTEQNCLYKEIVQPYPTQMRESEWNRAWVGINFSVNFWYWLLISIKRRVSSRERERTFRLINILHLARQWPFKGASPRESKLCCGWCSRRPGLNSFSDRPRMAATILTWVSSWLPEHQLGYVKAGELVSYLGPYPCLYWWVSSRRHFL